MTTTNDIVKIAKDYYISAFERAALAALISFSPIFASGPINYLAKKFIHWLAVQSAEQIELHAFFIHTDLRVSAQGRQYYDSIHRLNTLKAQGAPKAEIERVEKIALDAFSDLVRFNR